MFQLVDYDGQFNPKFDELWKTSDINNVGDEYSVVTVLGCQSSGKSTLLNALFGTSFEEMDSLSGRGQTTKGIWGVPVTYSQDGRPKKVFVVDVEGTDSKERGEDRLTFEHRAALFSLAVGDTVVINQWYTDIGRYTASNYGLLKTVLGVMLELGLGARTEDSRKTLLYFVIRDWTPAVTPLNKLRDLLMKDIRDIWKSITKPEEFAGSYADDFFDFEVVGLPSKYTQAEEFTSACEQMKPTVLPELTYSRGVPSDGFAMYSANVWDTIVSANQLDIPSQKEMVSIFRCEEIARTVLRDAVEWINSSPSLEILFTATQEVVSDESVAVKEVADVTDDSMAHGDHDVSETSANHLSEKVTAENSNIGSHAQHPKDMNNILRVALSRYHDVAKRYEPRICREKRDLVYEGVLSELQRRYDTFADTLRRCVTDESESILRNIRSAKHNVKSIVSFYESVGMGHKCPSVDVDGDTKLQYWAHLCKMVSDWSAYTIGQFQLSSSSTALDVSMSLAGLGDASEELVEYRHEFGSAQMLSHLSERLNEQSNRIVTDELREMVAQMVSESDDTLRQIGAAFVSSISEAVSADRKNTVDPALYQSLVQKAISNILVIQSIATEKLYAKCLNGLLGIDEKDIQTTKELMLYFSYVCIRKALTTRPDMIAQWVHDCFVALFEKDPFSGVPHYWPSSSPDQINKFYVAARDSTEKLVSVICTLNVTWPQLLEAASLHDSTDDSIVVDIANRHRLAEGHITTDSETNPMIRSAIVELTRDDVSDIVSPTEVPLFAAPKVATIWSISSRQMLGSCQQAQYIQATGGQRTHIPWWVYIALLVLGWNEIMWIFRSPVVMTLVIAAVAVFAGAYMTGNVMHVLHMGRGMSNFCVGTAIQIMQTIQNQQISGAVNPNNAVGATSQRPPSTAGHVE